MSVAGKLLLGGLAVIIVLAAVIYLIAWHDPQSVQARELNTPFRVWAWRAIWVGIGAGVLTALLGGGLFVIGRGVRSIVNGLSVPAEHGLYPGVLFVGRHVRQLENERYAQIVAALTNGNLDRIGQGPMKAILAPRSEENLLPEPEPLPTLTLSEATRVDPRTNPHWLMIGKTGSGKSTAMRHVLTTMGQRYPAEFVICEPNRGNWKDATHAWTVDGIAQAVAAVYEEQNRRAGLLAAHPTADHIMDLPGLHLPYLCLIFAEMDATMDNLYKLDRSQHRSTLVQLRDIARMGRKQGVCLFAESQAGLADVLDPNIARNFANIFLFNGSQQTAKTLGVSDLVSLPKLPVGTAFSMTHEQVVEFPPVERPTLRRSRLYQEVETLPLTAPEPLKQLPADAEADGLGAADQPSDPPAEVFIPAARSVMAAEAAVSLPEHINSADGLTLVQKEYIWRVYLATARTARNRRPSLRATEAHCYAGQAGGVKFYLVRDVVREMRRRHGGPQITDEEEA